MGYRVWVTNIDLTCSYSILPGYHGFDMEGALPTTEYHPDILLREGQGNFTMRLAYNELK